MESTVIADTGATNIYYDLKALLPKLDPSAPRFHVGTANGHMDRSSAMAKAAIHQLAHNFLTTVYVMPDSKHMLVGISPICDTGCKVTLAAQYVTVFSPNSRDILTGWSEATGIKL